MRGCRSGRASPVRWWVESFARLDDEPKPVPVIGAGGKVAFVAASRRYHVPISIRVEVGGERHEERGTLVLDRGGVRRIALGVEEHEV